ncbi:hypothetical protein D9757_010270 [Collybiopsis confluens]|uniref:Uncharacterized protein n=1 Tax=Collybiopsis confluens TaxID=2823264 RepID=A0A8H5HAY0_9AGAR|nr:hypothetical protein D9757_010270 [Collybiopsis confluens]
MSKNLGLDGPTFQQVRRIATKASVEATTAASASQESLLANIPGLQGLPTSSSHSWLSLEVLNEAQESAPGTNVVPTVSVTPSSRPSTGTRSSTDTTPKQHHVPMPPVQLIPIKSTMEAGAPVLDAIRNQVVTSSSSQTIRPSSSTITNIEQSNLNSSISAPSALSTTSKNGLKHCLLPLPHFHHPYQETRAATDPSAIVIQGISFDCCQTLQVKPWNHGGNRISFNHRASKVARQVLKQDQYLNASTTTIHEI